MFQACFSCSASSCMQPSANSQHHQDDVDTSRHVMHNLVRPIVTIQEIWLASCCHAAHTVCWLQASPKNCSYDIWDVRERVLKLLKLQASGGSAP